MALTRFGVSKGFACSISATVPLTTGAAMLVPDSVRYGLYVVADRPVEQSGRMGGVEEAGRIAQRHDAVPGATSPASPGSRSPTGPSSCRARSTSSVRVHRALRVRSADREDPRRIARSGDAAVLRFAVGRLRPKLPAAETTTMPASTARFAASVRGSVQEGLGDRRADRQVDDADVVGRAGSSPPIRAPR